MAGSESNQTKNILLHLFCPLNSEYDQDIPQSHTADQPTAPQGRATEHL